MAFEHASFMGVAISHLNAYTGDPREGSFNVMQLLGNDGEQWGTYNAVRGFQTVVGDQRLDLDKSGLPPGVQAEAFLNSESGRLGLALASHGWANRVDRDVEISLAGLTGSKRIRRWLVDPTHSSRWDTFEDDPAGSR
jgi:hypothetical protein